MKKAYLFSHYFCDPFYNMAFDEWMFSQALHNQRCIYLRLYTWSEGAVTFGFNQKRETALDFSKIGCTPVIRRITGGRALYHDSSELTYSVAAHMNNFSDDWSLTNTSQIIAALLVRFLDKIGIESYFMRNSSVENTKPNFFHKAPCFASHSRHEILSEGKKIIASAQRRINETLFQHGAIKINGLTSHPSILLDGNKPLEDNNIVVGEKEFWRFMDLFKDIFNEGLRINFTSLELKADEKYDISDYSDYVKKNNFEQRKIIKQN